MIISEPNKKMNSDREWFMDRKKDVALVICNKGVEIEELKMGEGYIYIKLHGIHLYAAYISPNITEESFKSKVDEIFEKAAKDPNNSIILGDINSKSPLWGAPRADERGKMVENLLSQLTWTPMNNGEHTFER